MIVGKVKKKSSKSIISLLSVNCDNWNVLMVGFKSQAEGEDYSISFLFLFPLPKHLLGFQQRGRVCPLLKQNISTKFRGKGGMRTGLGNQIGLGYRQIKEN